MKVHLAGMNKQDSAWFQVTGECMTPLIRKDDIVLSIPVVKLHIGDIVVIAAPLPAVHRVVKIKKGTYLLTKGDNSLTVDPPVIIDDLAGKVAAIVKKDRDPIYIQGKLWSVKNYVMAKYSWWCYLLWGLIHSNKYLSQMYHRCSSTLKIMYIFFAASITQVYSGKGR